MKLAPASTAACSAASDSASSTAPQEPPMAQAPKLTDETDQAGAAERAVVHARESIARARGIMPRA